MGKVENIVKNLVREMAKEGSADEAEKDADIADPNTETTAEHIAQDIKVEVSPKGLNALQKVFKNNNDNSNT